MNRPSPDDLNDIIMAEQREEIKKLKRENENLLYEIKCGYKNRKEIDKRMLELEKENEELKEKLEEADKYVVLTKIRNGEF